LKRWPFPIIAARMPYIALLLVDGKSRVDDHVCRTTWHRCMWLRTVATWRQQNCCLIASVKWTQEHWWEQLDWIC